MKLFLTTLALMGTLAFAGAVALPSPNPQASPELQADRWYNVSGDAPTLASLRGRAVLIEFWATW